MTENFTFRKEYWSGDSRDGSLVNGDGYHYFKIRTDGLIIEAFEVYESEEGDKVISPMPEMKNVNWLVDLGFDDFDALDEVEEFEYRQAIKIN